MKKILWAVVACAAAAWCVPSQAALTAGQKMAAEALIKQFSAPEFETRQKAVDRLVELGVDVIPLVKKALAETLDNEVKLRCEMVLKALGAVEAAPTPQQAARAKFGTEASKVTIHLKDAELDTVLQALADQSGNARIETPKDWEGKPVSLDVTDAPYWEAVNRLCADCKLAVVSDPMQGGALRLAPARNAAAPVVCSGPVDVRIDSVTLTKQYVAAQGPMNFMGAAPAMSLALTWFHEDRLRPLNVEANVTKIASAADKELVLGNNNNPMGMFGGAMMIMMGGNQNTCSGSFTAAVSELPERLQGLKSVEGVVKMTFGTGEREFKIESAEMGKTVTVGKDKVVLTQFQMQNGSATVGVTRTVDGKDVEDRFGSNTQYGIVLVDPKGNRHAATAPGGGMFNMRRGRGGPGLMRNVRAQVQGPGAPGGMVVIGDGGMANGGSVSYFQGLPDIEGAWTVLYVVPETTTVKECPFKLNDVPLP